MILAWVIYAQRREWPAKMAERFSFLYKLIFNKYWIDEIYNFLIVRPLKWFSENVLWGVVDAKVIDRWGVHGTGKIVLYWHRGLAWLQNGVVQQYLFFFVVGVVLLIWKVVF